MTTSKEKTLIPPYLPYRTLENLIQRLRVGGVPGRIDRSVISSFSGSIQAQILTTLRYLNLTNEQGEPTEKLEKLVATDGVDKQKVFKDIITSSYQFLYGEGVDLKKITYAQMTESFIKAGTSGDTTRKSIKLFMTLAGEAGITLSPHLKKARRSGPRRNVGKTKKEPEEIGADIQSRGNIGTGEQAPNNSWQGLLLSKFPSFDPAWPDDIKGRWFEGFNQLMAEMKKQK